jgi:hypothetical protein
MKSRTHSFTINVTFNRACTRSVALREMKDDGDINAGTHYCTQLDDGEPETFKVRSIRHAPRSRS